MAGRPGRKARLEREAGARGRKRFDRVARQEALRRVEQIGPAAVAAELGIAPATLRSWRKRLGDAAGPAVSGGVQEPAVGPSDDVEGRGEGDGLRERAASRRAAQRRAEDAAEAFLARSLASEGRNSMVAAGLLAERGRELEQAAREEEAHRKQLATVGGEQVIALIASIFESVGLRVPVGIAETILRGETPTAEAKVAARRELGLAERVEAAGEAAEMPVLAPAAEDVDPGIQRLPEDEPDEEEGELTDETLLADLTGEQRERYGALDAAQKADLLSRRRQNASDAAEQERIWGEVSERTKDDYLREHRELPRAMRAAALDARRGRRPAAEQWGIGARLRELTTHPGLR